MTNQPSPSPPHTLCPSEHLLFGGGRPKAPPLLQPLHLPTLPLLYLCLLSLYHSFIQVTGACKLLLYFSSDCPDTDFCATLVDVYPPSSDFPDGFAMNLARCLMRVHPCVGGSMNLARCLVRVHPCVGGYVERIG